MSAAGIPTEWYFITPPQDVSWQKDSNVTEIDTYGTNNPYLAYGTTKLRKLTLGNALVEGFSDSKAVENNIVALEACMRMVLEEASGYTSPFCWNVFAGNKSYGTYIITSVSVQEQMRDMSGRATRATVNVSLQEVPPYQVASGIDITSTAIQGAADEKYAQELNKGNEAGQQDQKAQNAKNNNGSGGTGGGGTGGGGNSGGAGSTSQGPTGSGANTNNAFNQAGL